MKKEVQTKLDALQTSFLKNLPGKLADIEEKWHALTLHFSKDDFTIFHRSIHSLTGSSGVYGYTLLYNVARDFEVYLQPLLNSDELTPMQISEISHNVEKMKNVAGKEMEN